MNKDLINRVLYETHDKWEDKVEVKYRKEFEEYLILFIKEEEKCIQELELILEYGKGEEMLLIQKGIKQVLAATYPESHKSVMHEFFVRFKKSKFFEVD